MMNICDLSVYDGCWVLGLYLEYIYIFSNICPFVIWLYECGKIRSLNLRLITDDFCRSKWTSGPFALSNPW